jgi:hypothetical protein
LSSGRRTRRFPHNTTSLPSGSPPTLAAHYILRASSPRERQRNQKIAPTCSGIVSMKSRNGAKPASKSQPIAWGRQTISRSRKKCQLACKPGSVPADCSAAMAIHLGRVLPRASSNQPGRRCGNAFRREPKPASRAVPIRFCSRRGLPCRVCCQPRGALLPHPFTLTVSKARA